MGNYIDNLVAEPIGESKENGLQEPWEIKELSELTKDEGLRLNPYQDTLGNWTIGYGHTEGVTGSTAEITPQKALELLVIDFKDALGVALRVYGATPLEELTEPRRGAIANMAFNLGYKLEQFNKKPNGSLQRIRRGEYDKAADQLVESLWAQQVKRRASRIAYRIRTNKYAPRS